MDPLGRSSSSRSKQTGRVVMPRYSSDTAEWIGMDITNNYTYSLVGEKLKPHKEKYAPSSGFGLEAELVPAPIEL